MGTSSSYKGSNSASWRTARERFAELESNDSSGNSGGDSEVPADADAAAAALAAALIHDSPKKTVEQLNFPTSSLLLGTSGAGAGGGAGVDRNRKRRRQQTRKRSSSSTQRQTIKNAARGAAAIRAAYGLVNGNAEILRDYGLDLTALQQLAPRQQCLKIADAILGDANNPDDAALRRATIEHLKTIILAETPLSIEDTIRSFVAEWIFQVGLVELKAENNENPIPEDQLQQNEAQLHKVIQIKVKRMSFPSADQLTAQRFSNATAKLTRDALKLIEAMRS